MNPHVLKMNSKTLNYLVHPIIFHSKSQSRQLKLSNTYMTPILQL